MSKQMASICGRSWARVGLSDEISLEDCDCGRGKFSNQDDRQETVLAWKLDLFAALTLPLTILVFSYSVIHEFLRTQSIKGLRLVVERAKVIRTDDKLELQYQLMTITKNERKLAVTASLYNKLFKFLLFEQIRNLETK